MKRFYNYLLALNLLAMTTVWPFADAAGQHCPFGGCPNGGFGGSGFGGTSHFRPQYQAPIQPRFQSVQPQYRPTPRINVMPQMQPARKVTQIPRINVVPQAPVKPQMVKSQPVKPQVNVVPRTKSPVPTSIAAPKPNALTPVAAKSPSAPGPASTPRKRPVATPVNAGPTNLLASPTQADLDRMISQIGNRDRRLLDQLRQLTSPRLDPVIVDLRVQVTDGAFDGGDLADLLAAVTALGLPPADQQALLDLIAQLAIDQQLIDWLLATDPGMSDLPFGPDVPLVLVPGLPADLLMPLDGGVVLIGTGAPGDEILLGFGDPLEVAGLPVPLDGAEPADEATGTFAAGEIIIGNQASDLVNYNLNQQPQQLAPEFEQTLTAGTPWTIEFDRGSNFGMARYQLSEGYYFFSLTERGWELFKKTFRTTLDNSNTFAFNYVVDNQQQTINPGESHDLTGPFPPVVRFDNGEGTETARRLDSGTYQVAISEDLTLDIYRAEDVSLPEAQSAAASIAQAPAAAARPATQAAAKAPTAKPATTAAKASAPKQVRRTTATSMTSTKASTMAAKKTGRSLPRGFTLFDPVKALTDARSAQRFPQAFTLFQDAVEEMPVALKQ